VISAPFHTNSNKQHMVQWEVCQYQVDTFGREHEQVCVPSKVCVDLPLLPKLYGVVAVLTRKVLRKDTWQNGRIVASSKTKLGLCKRLSYQLPRTGKLVPNDVAKLIRNEVNEQVVFPIGDSKICDYVNYNLEQYLVDDPNDCKKFYSCVREYNGAYRMLEDGAWWAWRAYHMSCPQGTVFDGTTCQVGVTCLTYKDIDEHSIEKEGIEKSKKLSLEKDVDLVDFIEDPVDIVDTSNITEEEFDATDDEFSTDSKEEIISAQETPTIIKVIPVNEFTDVENNQIKFSLDRNTIVKKIPNFITDNDTRKNTYEAELEEDIIDKDIESGSSKEDDLLPLEGIIDRPTQKNLLLTKEISQNNSDVKTTDLHVVTEISNSPQDTTTSAIENAENTKDTLHSTFEHGESKVIPDINDKSTAVEQELLIPKGETSVMTNMIIFENTATESDTNFVEIEVLKTTEMTSSDELEINTFTDSATTSFETESSSTTEYGSTLKPEITSDIDSETELIPTLVESELTEENISIEQEMTSVVDTMTDMISTSVEPEDLKIAEENTSVEPEIISFADSVTEMLITSVNPEMLINSEETTSVQPERTSLTNSVAESITTSVEPELISTEETTSVDTDMTFSAEYVTSDEPELTIKKEASSAKPDINTIADPKTEIITTSVKPELLMTTTETKSVNSEVTSPADSVTEFITTPESQEFLIREETNSVKQDTTSFPDSVTELINTSVETELLVATEESTSVNQEMPPPADSLTELIPTSDEPESVTTEEATSDTTTFTYSMTVLVNTSTESESSLTTAETTSVKPEILIKSEESTSVQPERISLTNSVAELITTSVEPEFLISTEEPTSVDTDITLSADYMTSDEPEWTINEEVTSVKHDINTIADPKTEIITTSLKPELLMKTTETKSVNSEGTSPADSVSEFSTTPEGPELLIREETNSVKPDRTSFLDSVTELIATSVETELLISTEKSTSVNQEMPSPTDSLTELIATSEELELMTTEEATSIQPDTTTFTDSLTELVNTSTEPELLLTTAETTSVKPEMTSIIDSVTEVIKPKSMRRVKESTSLEPDMTSLSHFETEFKAASVEPDMFITTEEIDSVKPEMASLADSVTELATTLEESELLTTTEETKSVELRETVTPLVEEVSVVNDNSKMSNPRFLPENELFLDFFNEEEGSGENVEVDLNRQPRIMDEDPVKRLISYRTEKSISKVVRNHS